MSTNPSPNQNKWVRNNVGNLHRFSGGGTNLQGRRREELASKLATVSLGNSFENLMAVLTFESILTGFIVLFSLYYFFFYKKKSLSSKCLETRSNPTTSDPLLSSSEANSPNSPSFVSTLSKTQLDASLQSPKDHVFTLDELSHFDGSDTTTPVYISVKGTVFDVSPNRGMYATGNPYSIFAGKDASLALGLSSLKPEHCRHDYSSLSPKQLKVLDDWFAYYKKRYNIMGSVKFE